MFSNLTEKILTYTKEFLDTSLDVLKHDNHATQKYRMAIAGVKGKDVIKEKNTFGSTKTVNDVPVIGFSPIFSRDVSLSNESSRMHSSLINPPVCLISFQVSSAYINLVNEYAQAHLMEKIILFKNHQINKKVEKVEEHHYKDAQILCIQSWFVGNTAVVAMMIQANALQIEFKDVTGPINKQNGKHKVEITRQGIAKG